MRDLYCEDDEEESMQRAASNTTNQQHKGQHRCDTMAEQRRGIPSISSATQTDKEPTQERHGKHHNWMHNRQHSRAAGKAGKRISERSTGLCQKVKCDVTM